MTKPPLNIAIVILAAGASKRMGEPKQMLQWGNTSLLGHTIQTALKVQSKDVFVVLGANYSLLSNEIRQYPITILNNDDWKMGLGKSIAKGVKYLKNIESNLEGVLIVLADQPFISIDFLELMLQCFVPNKNQIIATSYEEGKYGVPVLFDKVYFKELSQLCNNQGAKYLLKKHESQVKVLMPPLKNIDLDYKEDYKKAFNASFKN